MLAMIDLNSLEKQISIERHLVLLNLPNGCWLLLYSSIKIFPSNEQRINLIETSNFSLFCFVYLPFDCSIRYNSSYFLLNIFHKSNLYFPFVLFSLVTLSMLSDRDEWTRELTHSVVLSSFLFLSFFLNSNWPFLSFLFSWLDAIFDHSRASFPVLMFF